MVSRKPHVKLGVPVSDPADPDGAPGTDPASPSETAKTVKTGIMHLTEVSLSPPNRGEGQGERILFFN